MSAEDWIPDFDLEDLFKDIDPDYGYKQKAGYTTCWFCGAIPLYWRKVDKKWVLFESNGIPHKCLPPEIKGSIFKNASNSQVS